MGFKLVLQKFLQTTVYYILEDYKCTVRKMLYINIETKVIYQENQADWEYGSDTQHKSSELPKISPTPSAECQLSPNCPCWKSRLISSNPSLCYGIPVPGILPLQGISVQEGHKGELLWWSPIAALQVLLNPCQALKPWSLPSCRIRAAAVTQGLWSWTWFALVQSRMKILSIKAQKKV